MIPSAMHASAITLPPVGITETIMSELTKAIDESAKRRGHTPYNYVISRYLSSANSNYENEYIVEGGDVKKQWHLGQGNILSFFILLKPPMFYEYAMYSGVVQNAATEVGYKYCARARTELVEPHTLPEEQRNCIAFRIVMFYAPNTEHLPDRIVIWRSMCACNKCFRYDPPYSLQATDLDREITVNGIIYRIDDVCRLFPEVTSCSAVKLAPVDLKNSTRLATIKDVKEAIFNSLPEGEKEFERHRIEELSAEQRFYKDFLTISRGKLTSQTSGSEKKLLNTLFYKEMLVLDDVDYMLVGIEASASKRFFKVIKLENGTKLKWNVEEILEAIRQTREL